MVTIFCWAEPAMGRRPGDVLVQAIDEDGEVLAGHLSSSVEWAKQEIEKGVSREEAYQEVWGWKDAGTV